MLFLFQRMINGERSIRYALQSAYTLSKQLEKIYLPLFGEKVSPSLAFP